MLRPFTFRKGKEKSLKVKFLKVVIERYVLNVHIYVQNVFCLMIGADKPFKIITNTELTLETRVDHTRRWHYVANVIIPHVEPVTCFYSSGL